MSDRDFRNKVIELQDTLMPYALSLTNDREDANDLMQETMYKAMKYRTKFEDGTNMNAWMYIIMKNTFINTYRKRSKIYFSEINDELLSGKFNKPYNGLDMEDLTNIVSSIPESIRTPFMRYFNGYTYQEIADEFSIPLGTVKSKIFSARKELKDRLSKVGVTSSSMYA